MPKKIAKLALYWLGAATVAPLLAAACAGAPLSLGETAGAGGKASEAGSNASGGTSSDSGGSSNSSGVGGSSQETCDKSACGPQLGLLNQLCADGSMSGPTGRCLKRADDSCGWEVLQCPPDQPGAGGDASAGGPSTGGSSTGGSSTGGSSTSGSSAGGASGGLCGGKTCTADQRCCGPAECGFCVNKASGAGCGNTCPGSGGSGGTGGAPDCSQLLANVTKTQAAAQTCNPASAKPTAECAGSLEGLCCPIGVESVEPTASANVSYLNALKAYKASCTSECPKIACIDPQVGDCRASSATSGKCGP